MAVTQMLAPPMLNKREAKEFELIQEYRDIQEMESHEAGFVSRVGEDFTTWGHEQFEQGHRIKRLGALVVGGVTQAADRGRAMVFVLPTVFDEITTHAVEHSWNGYQAATASAVAVGGIFAAWGYAVGKSFKYALDKFPETTERFIQNHPVAISVLSSAIGGMPTKRDLQNAQPEKPEEGYDVKPYQTRKSMLGKAALAVDRGLRGGLMYGTTAHVGIAKANEHSDESNDTRRRVVTAESGIALGSVAAIVSTLMTHNSFGLAEDIKNVVTDKELLRNVAFGSIGYAMVANKVSRVLVKRKARKLLEKLESQEASESQNQTVTTSQL